MVNEVKSAVCKTVATGYVSSTLTLPTIKNENGKLITKTRIMKTKVLVKLYIEIKKAIAAEISKVDGKVQKIAAKLKVDNEKLDVKYDEILHQQLSNTIKASNKQEVLEAEKLELKKLL